MSLLSYLLALSLALAPVGLRAGETPKPEPAAKTGKAPAQAIRQEAGKAHGIPIQGSEKFRKQIATSLDLLQQKAPDSYRNVTRYVGRIEEGERSGMWAYKTPPTYEVSDRTAFYSVTWCASCIAHDALHSKLYHEQRQNRRGAVPAEAWVGTEAERKCIEHQLDVLAKTGAPRREIDYCKSLDGTHHDVNKDGKYDWSDYWERKW